MTCHPPFPGSALTRFGTAPAPLFTLEQARAHLRVDPEFGTSPPSHRDDPLIEECFQAAVDELEGVTGWLGRVLVRQTWRLSLDRFPSGGEIVFPLPPLQSVERVSYLDADGVRQDLTDEAGSPPGTGYRVTTGGLVGSISPVFDGAWPSGRIDRGAVQVEFTAGFGDPADVPAAIRRWVATRAATFYEHRETAVVGTIATMIPAYMHNLENWRVRGLIE